MRVIHLNVPRDVLKTLLDGKQQNVPYTITGDGEPLRIVLWAQESPPKAKKFGGLT